jgi:hypothetical protein
MQYPDKVITEIILAVYEITVTFLVDTIVQYFQLIG